MNGSQLTQRVRRIAALALCFACAGTGQAWAAGELLWTRTHADTNVYSGAKVAVDANGNVIVLTTNIVVVGGVFNFRDYLTIKYNAQGVQQWERTYDGPAGGQVDQAAAVAVDGSGNIYVTGTSWSGVGYQSEIATIKYDPNGNQLWVARYDNLANGTDSGNSIAVDAQGNVFVAGSTDTMRSEACPGTGSSDFVVLKYGSQGGAPLWVATYNGPGARTVYPSRATCGLECVAGQPPPPAPLPLVVDGNDGAGPVVLDAAGNIYVTGNSAGVPYAGCTARLYADDNDCVGTVIAVPCAGRNDIATIKYSSTGQELWVARYDGPGHLTDNSAGLAVDAQGNVFVAGTSFSASTGSDYLTVKYDASGAQQWVRSYTGTGTNRDDVTNAIAVDSQGRVTVTGSVSVDEKKPCNGLSAAHDIVTIQYAANGTQRWLQKQSGGGTCSWDIGIAIAVDASDNVIMAGKQRGAIQQGDYVTIKYNPSGQVVWNRTYADGMAQAVAVSASGHVHVAGPGATLRTLKYAP